MKYCPITYEIINDQECYSQRGLKLLSPRITKLAALALSAAEQRAEAIAHADKMSIRGTA